MRSLEREERETNRGELPSGWDEQRIRDLLSHYEDQTDEEAAAEDEDGVTG